MGQEISDVRRKQAREIREGKDRMGERSKSQFCWCYGKDLNEKNVKECIQITNTFREMTLEPQ